MVNCPVCKQAMKTQQAEGIAIDVCPLHGVWLDKGELFALTEAKRASEGSFVLKDMIRQRIEPRRDETRRLACPSCGRQMQLETYEDTQIDRCPEHGVFLDAGELEAIENNLRLDPVYVRGIALRIGDAKY